MATFLVLELHSGPQWDKSRPLEEQSDWPAHASFMDRLVDSVDTIDPWTIRLDGR